MTKKSDGNGQDNQPAKENPNFDAFDLVQINKIVCSDLLGGKCVHKNYELYTTDALYSQFIKADDGRYRIDGSSLILIILNNHLASVEHVVPPDYGGDAVIAVPSDVLLPSSYKRQTGLDVTQAEPDSPQTVASTNKNSDDIASEKQDDTALPVRTRSAKITQITDLDADDAPASSDNKFIDGMMINGKPVNLPPAAGGGASVSLKSDDA